MRLTDLEELCAVYLLRCLPKRNALMYNLIACCKEYNIDPHTYFVDVITRIGVHKINEVKELLPHNWKPLSEVTPSATPAAESAKAV